MNITIDNYDIYLFDNKLDSFTNQVNKIHNHKKLFLITDETVYKLHYKALARAFDSYEIVTVIASSKSFESFVSTVNELLEKGITKTDLLVAFGGGTIGDLTGLIAGTLFRGMKYIQIPTTLLAQIDSSIGGKTAIDTKFGKNLVGVFHNPSLVLIDISFLQTLSKREYNNGLAEAIKMALLFDEKVYEKIKKNDLLSLTDILKILNYKKQVVLEDYYDQGIRQILNFGHTFGHAIEKTNNYQTFKHGEAISHGMIISLEIGVRLNICKKELLDDVFSLLKNKGLLNIEINQYSSYLSDLKYDKKNNDSGLNFIFLEKIGVPRIVNLKVGDL